jgi:heme exporter protein D
MNLGPHADFIVAAYSITAVVILVLVAWVAFDHVAQKRNLARLEARGVTRRSDRAVESGV